MSGGIGVAVWAIGTAIHRESVNRTTRSETSGHTTDAEAEEKQ